MNDCFRKNLSDVGSEVNGDGSTLSAESEEKLMEEFGMCIARFDVGGSEMQGKFARTFSVQMKDV